MNAASAPEHTLRLATAGDVPALAALYARCASEMGPQVYATAQVQAWQSFGADTPAFRDYVLGARTWIACDAGSDAPLGFCGIDAAGEVRSLYVAPPCTRRGLGRLLLGHALADAQSCGCARFEVWATPFSRPLFERAGFTLRETRTEAWKGVLFERHRLHRG